MTPFVRLSCWSVFLITLLVACTGDDGAQAVRPGQPEVVQGDEGGGQVAGADDVGGDRDLAAALPDSFEIVGAGPTERHVPRGAVEGGFVAVVGATPDDPRFFEVSFFDFNNPAELAAAVPFVGRAEDVPTQLLPTTGVEFAFVEDGVGGERTRRESLQLLGAGPDPQSTFRGDLGRRRLAIGAARILQPEDVDGLLTLVALDAWPEDGGAPRGMQVLVDEVLPAGGIVLLQSGGETVEIELREEVSAGWFDYITWEDPIATSLPPIEGEAKISVQGPSDFGVDGEPTEPTRTAIWTEDGRLVTIVHPQMADGLVASLFDAVRATSVVDVLALADVHGSLPGSEPGDGGAQPDDAVAAPAPSEETVAALQNFAETVRGRELGVNVRYQFVDRLSPDRAGLMFLSSRLWSLLTRLDLVEPEQSRVAANQARIEQLRGVPGTVARQATSAFTEMVVVHEITHTIDETLDADLSACSPEPFSPSQALTEGNAHRVAAAYGASLAEDRRADVPTFPAIFPFVDERLSGASRNSMEFPYDEGRAFAEAIAAAGGEQAIDAALRKPPVSTEQILFPDAYLSGDEPAIVAPPDLPEGATVLDEGVLGAYLLLLAVEGRASSAQIDGREAVTGWNGDRYVLYRQGTTECLEAVIEMDDPVAAARLAAALDQSGRSVLAIDVEVRLKACGMR